MSDLFSPDLSSVAETLLIPLYNRAMESQRPDAIMKDEKAVVLMKKIGYNFDQITKIRMFDANKVARVMLTREMDRYTRVFLNRHPKAVVVHIGCGLDSRFGRLRGGYRPSHRSCGGWKPGSIRRDFSHSDHQRRLDAALPASRRDCHRCGRSAFTCCDRCA